jgi:hypothetical protein
LWLVLTGPKVPDVGGPVVGQAQGRPVKTDGARLGASVQPHHGLGATSHDICEIANPATQNVSKCEIYQRLEICRLVNFNPLNNANRWAD